jgi:predicted flap endonuclease-1-like 5' DNA nuclease
LTSRIFLEASQKGENYLSRPRELEEAGIDMRLDYILYVLAAVLLIITVVPFVAPIGVETTETRSVWVVATVVLGLLSIGLGYSQRPKTKAQACEPAVAIPQTTMPETQPATKMEAPKEEKASIKEAPAMLTPVATMDLTQVKGIGEKRAMQLKALGINSVDELANASAKNIAEKLKVSPKIVDKWVASAKKLVK